MLAALLGVLLFVPVQKRDTRDSIVLTNGSRVRGRVVLELDEEVLIRVGSTERRIPRSRIKTMSSIAQAHRKAYQEYRRAGDDPDALMLLAEFCTRSQLHHTARLLYHRVLLRNPNHEGAHNRLGHRKRRGKWLVPGRGGWMSLERADKVRRDWGKAWELRSEHFIVRCSGGLDTTVNALFELEILYLTFLDLFQKKLELREVLEPTKVYVYGPEDSFPKDRPCFVGRENAIYTRNDGRRVDALFHEGTHSLLYRTTEGAAKSRGNLPQWVDEGFAMYMEGVLDGRRPGRPVFHRSRRDPGPFRHMAAAKKPFTIQRVLNFASGEFLASSHNGLKYAQSYVLVHYLLHGVPEDLQEKFYTYLREATRGKGQGSTFRRIFRRELKLLEKGYRTYSTFGK